MPVLYSPFAKDSLPILSCNNDFHCPREPHQKTSIKNDGQVSIRAGCASSFHARIAIFRADIRAGHKVPVAHQDPPGRQSDMKGPPPASEYLPTEDGGYQLYKAAGKLQGKKALITGGDSGIGRATAILYAMEGAESTIAYLPEEEKDAQETKRLVEKYGTKCHLFATDLKDKKNCKATVDKALEWMGRINILVNNAAYQMMVQDIQELSE